MEFMSSGSAILMGQTLNTNFFFSNFSDTAGISRLNPGISRQKSLIPLVSKGIPNFLAPTPSRGRPLPHRKVSGLKSLGLGSFFVPDVRPMHFPRFFGGTEKVPQKNCVTKILPNIRVNFLVRFASKPLFYWVMTGNPLELFRKFSLALGLFLGS